MLNIILIRPGSTDFDEQGRIKGTLDVPLNEQGNEEVAQTIDEMDELSITAVYCSPNQCAVETAEAIAAVRDLKAKQLADLRNLNHGLWHGKLVEEVKRRQPKVYRQWQENPEGICPPEGELVSAMRARVGAVLAKLSRKHKDETIALVAPEPLASVVRSQLKETGLGDLWKVECDSGGWEMLEVAGSMPK
jgi:broad specificity phosphatase PhoE